MKKNEKGFGLLEVVPVTVVIGLIIVIGWLLFNRQKDADNIESITTNSASEKINEDPQPQTASEARVTVMPFLGTKSFTVSFPSGWERDMRISEVAPVYRKTIEGVIYFISFVNGEMSQNPGYDTEGFLNRYGHKNTTLKTLTTAKGIKIYIVKSFSEASGDGVLLLSASEPDPNNSYIKYEDQNIGINIQRAGTQSAAEIDFSARGFDTLVNDFEAIAASLDI